MRLFKNLKARILKSIITWSEMGKQTAQAKEVYWGDCKSNKSNQINRSKKINQFKSNVGFCWTFE